MMTYLYRLFAYHIVLLFGELLFCFKMKRRKLFWLRFIPLTAAYAVFPYLLPDTWYNGFFMIGSWFSWIFIFIFAVSVLLMWVCFDAKFSEVLFIGLSAYSVENLFSNFRQALNSVLRSIGFPVGGNGIPMFIINLVILTLLFALYYIVLIMRYRRVDEFYADYISKPTLIMFCSIVLVVTYMLSWWSGQKGFGNMAVYIYAGVCCLLLLVVQFGLFYGGKMSTDKVIAEHMLTALAEQKKMSEENINLINIKCHDLKRQIALMRTAGESEEKKKLIDELEDMVMIYDSELRTGNSALDVILTEKSLYCNSNDIRISCVIDGEKLGFMEKSDIYALFGNAIDNAIESVMKAEKDKRVICFNVGLHGEILVIHMDNYCEEEPTFEGGAPITTKSEKGYHGFGTKSIRYVAEKYGGNVVMRVVDKRFCLDITLPYENKAA